MLVGTNCIVSTSFSSCHVQLFSFRHFSISLAVYTFPSVLNCSANFASADLKLSTRLSVIPEILTSATAKGEKSGIPFLYSTPFTPYLSKISLTLGSSEINTDSPLSSVQYPLVLGLAGQFLILSSYLLFLGTTSYPFVYNPSS